MSDATDSQHETITTTGTTPQRMGGVDPVVSGVVSHGTYSARVVAHEHGGGSNRAAWDVAFSFYVDENGTLTIDGGGALATLMHQSNGLAALTWAVQAAINSGRVWITVTGSMGLTVDWGIAYDAYWTYED